jgi:hypothetical protein
MKTIVAGRFLSLDGVIETAGQRAGPWCSQQLGSVNAVRDAARRARSGVS